MSLDVAPEIETTVRQYAEREGVSLDELMARAFPPIGPLPQPSQPDAEDPTARVNSLLRQWQQEYGLPRRPDGRVHTSAEELFAQWDAEDAQLTPEEAEAERHHWEDIQTEHQGVTI